MGFNWDQRNVNSALNPNPNPRNTIKALDEDFSCFGVPNTVVSDNETMFTGKEFKDYCYSLVIELTMTPAYNPRSNGQAERFVDTFKRALRKNQGIETEEKDIQKFLAVYRITPNLNTNSNLSSAEIMFAHKIHSVFDRISLSQKKKSYTKINENTHSEITVQERVIERSGIIMKRIGRMTYIMKKKKKI